jgi:phosphoenolpyruvate carboxykinase (ATP)
VQETGVRNGAHGADKFGFKDLAGVHWNLLDAVLVEHAIRNGEGSLVQGGAFCAETGVHTGRSPKDKYTVADALTENSVWWDGNRKLASENFRLLYDDMIAHARSKTLYAQDLHGGADPKYRIKTRVFTELAWHSLFIRQLLIRPPVAELANFVPELTIVDLPSFKADPKRHGVRTDTIIAIDFTKKIILIGNSSYAGEMKKSVFTTLNFYLPAQGVVPMHCSANVGKEGDVALFFGLSGTGKTTLSADPNRTLIGDDEHGWSEDGIFNFEGGCYAKCIKLSAEAEPEIYAATNRFGTVLENVVFDPETRICDFDSDELTENTRSAYPLEFMPLASRSGCAGQPKNIVFLTADAFGVMPPIAKLTPAQAMYHFLSGYTAKVAGTEKGLVGVEPEFSTCFAAPFLPRPQHAAREDPEAQCRLLAGQFRLDRRHLWHRAAHADQSDTRARHRCARRFIEERKLSHRSLFRLRGADFGARRRAASALSDEDLEGQSGIRCDRPQARWHVPKQFHQVRKAGRCRSPRRSAGSAIGGGVMTGIADWINPRTCTHKLRSTSNGSANVRSALISGHQADMP